jgi:tRNA (cytosine38-C5)-methyltransferase
MRVVEFYSGIGGMHYAARHLHTAHVVAAFDVNPLANDVYAYNFGFRPYSVRDHFRRDINDCHMIF